MKEFAPSETRCQKLEVDLIVSNVNSEGIIFEMFKKQLELRSSLRNVLSA